MAACRWFGAIYEERNYQLHTDCGGKSKVSPNGGQKLNHTAHDITFDYNDQF
jgi:hypothetical protein